MHRLSSAYDRSRLSNKFKSKQERMIMGRTHEALERAEKGMRGFQ
jgi:hypothetical protein